MLSTPAFNGTHAHKSQRPHPSLPCRSMQLDALQVPLCAREYQRKAGIRCLQMKDTRPSFVESQRQETEQLSHVIQLPESLPTLLPSEETWQLNNRHFLFFFFLFTSLLQLADNIRQLAESTHNLKIAEVGWEDTHCWKSRGRKREVFALKGQMTTPEEPFQVRKRGRVQKSLIVPLPMYSLDGGCTTSYL